MKKLIFMLLSAASLTAFAQSSILYGVSFVKPKIGQNTAFETAWKTHVARFHQGDDKRQVFEVLSGDLAGSYQLVDGPFSYADMDKEPKNKTAHDIDYETNVASKLASATGPYVYRWADTLSFNGNANTDKYAFTVYTLKMNRMPELTAEFRRILVIDSAINSPVSFNGYIQQMGGSDQQLVIVSNLKEGFKQLETNYFAGLTDKFKQAYLNKYSQAQWDKRMTLLADVTTGYQTYLVRRRADLGSR